MPRGILLDIEGTTTPLSFVHDVLFPFARRHMAEYLRRANLQDLKSEHDEDVRNGNSPPEWSEIPEQYVFWLMDQDRKSTALKRIQGEIWQDGYNTDKLRGEVYIDVAKALKQWRKLVIDVRIFSSGSVLAQRLLFSRTNDGDLTIYLRGYFDTTTGAKGDPESYRQIAAAFGLPASDILFVSDVTRELDAARLAGMQTALCVRPGNQPQPLNGHPTITSFEELN